VLHVQIYYCMHVCCCYSTNCIYDRNLQDIIWEIWQVCHATLPVEGHAVTRGHNWRLHKFRARYNLRKYYFTNRVVNIWNSLPSYVISAETVNCCKSRLDNFWKNQDIIWLSRNRKPKWNSRYIILLVYISNSMLYVENGGGGKVRGASLRGGKMRGTVRGTLWLVGG